MEDPKDPKGLSVPSDSDSQGTPKSYPTLEEAHVAQNGEEVSLASDGERENDQISEVSLGLSDESRGYEKTQGSEKRIDGDADSVSGNLAATDAEGNSKKKRKQ